ncbi:structural maintenance of chromosomes flexible hinge domain-containing protein 1 isoform X2 [Centropristis striata]|uniref:structural maintenance of chromosomes flexible hinge domain-containing protein 1 isoform X2 n=1 Tax=Centropristis striata TaxID=184440 RepID=UPI0027E13CC7|nr:structural maintenance of chromosomes flexible hinge domain-containing protein 1 isoform X2 [Centropristis striata]
MEAGRVRNKTINVYDCRFDKRVNKKSLETGGLDFNGFLQLLQRKFALQLNDTFVLTTSDRTVLDFDKFEKLQDGSTILLLQQEDQALAAATEEEISFMPHYDTLIRCGMYEYYASDGRQPLAYALAELIDNSLSATVRNTGVRTIEIQMMFDETLGKPAVIVLDNGCGMTFQKLNNWAVYRLSKFASKQETYIRPEPVPRSLNSDISFFGVGGKQAIFYIGDSVRMITKSARSLDVHELILSKEEFERKERDKEDIYKGTIKTRKPTDSSHVVKDDEHFIHRLIADEREKKSFTAVVITGVLPQHVKLLKDDFDVWTRQLADIYHYYIYGVNGRDMRSYDTNSDHIPKIDIQITMREKPPRCPRAMNLREVENDMQTLYISSAQDTFEFKAVAEKDTGTVEGIIRYHPFLYDRETFPEDPHAVQNSPADDYNETESGVFNQARGKRPIFDCFWNGRLVPYTKLDEFDWCKVKKETKDLAESYSRISGVLFTDDKFQVSTNKLTFTDLGKLKDQKTIFTRMVNGQPKRAIMQKEFTEWLKNCHMKYDKQVKFLGYKETITRTESDLPKREQSPWSTFSSIERDGKIYKAGQLVKSLRTQPILYGSVVRFLLYGGYDGDVFANGGDVELVLEPKAFHDQIRTIPISKIDKTATDEAIKKHIDNDAARLPESLNVDWTEGDPWPENAVLPAGTVLGPLKVAILNKKQESLSKMPAARQGGGKKLSVVLRVVRHDPKGEEEVAFAVAPFAKTAFYFKKIEILNKLGKYTLSLNAVITESDATTFGDKELPGYKLKFTIKEGSAESFRIGEVGATLVGVSFNIPLLIKDGCGHATSPPPDLKPVLNCSGLDLSYETVGSSGTTFVIKGVKARGKVLSYQQSKTHDLKVTLPGLKEHTQTIKICLLPGNPHSLHVTPEENPITVENGNPVTFKVEVLDESGNITTRPKQIINCQVEGLPPKATDCSSTGAGQLVTNPIEVQIINGEPQNLQVQFKMPSQRNVESVVRQLRVIPSTRVTRMELCSDNNLVLRNDEKIEWLAGSLLQNLFYKLYDEAGREVPPTVQTASKIKVNWAKDANRKDLANGKLPDIQVHKHVKEERFYQVSYQDQNVSVSFNIVPRPDEPVRLKATLLQNTVKLGEILPGNINLELVDQYDNVTKALTSTCTKHMTAEAEGLNKSAITFEWQESSCSVLVTGVQFQSGTPGPRDLCFAYGSYEERVTIKVTAGVPALLKLVSEPDKPLQVLNGKGIPTPFLVQLCDEWGNHSTDQRVVVTLMSSPATLKVETAVTSQPVNAKGQASFTVKSVSGPKGYYQLEFNGSLNNKPIPGPSVNLTVIPDSTKPVSLSVEFDTRAKFPAAGTFPVFSVTVVSEDGNPITANPADASMFLWMGAPSGNAPPHTATELKCSKPLRNEKNDRLHFRDKEIPEQVGKHTVQFSLRIGGTNELLSDQILITVVANQPVKLGPVSKPQTPVVFYSVAVADRTLVENMTLMIMDLYGNPTGQDLNGNVMISIKSGDGKKTFPLFEDKTNCFKINLAEGKAHIPRLAIMQNSPGENGGTYVLVFNPKVPMLPTPLPPFELPFQFFNDAENQRKISQLSVKKDELTATLDKYEEFFSDSRELLQLLTSQSLDANNKEAELRQELKRRNVTVAQTIPEIDKLIGERKTEMDRILNAPGRKFSIPDPFKGQPDVLGMVGHLAYVQDDAAAWVISWCIRGDMNCVVAATTEAAMKIYADTQGTQQVMALDQVHVFPQRTLPHIRNGCRLFDPPGNPVFATELLIYPNEREMCIKVFKNLLRETILIDDLESGTKYRAAVVAMKMPCPTILTRQGERITAQAKFGGSQNKAPPIHTFDGNMFGAPRPQQYYTLKQHLDLLTKHKAAMVNRDKTAKERENHLKGMKSPEMLKKQQDMEEKKKQLMAIEGQLVASPGRPPKRSLGGAGEQSGTTPKRAR